MSLLGTVKRMPVVGPLAVRVKQMLTGDDGTQAGEARALRKVLEENDPKYLVDVGAHDGVSLSNSRPFVLEGWTGVLVEPMPPLFGKLQETYKNTPNVRCVNMAVAENPGEADFFIGADGPEGFTGTLCQDQNQWFEQQRSGQKIKVRVETLTNILREAKFPKDFGLLMIDTEGMDYECLRGLDFSQFRPRVIVTEEYKWNADKHAAKYKLLEDAGYKLVRRVGCNTLWRHRDFIS